MFKSISQSNLILQKTHYLSINFKVKIIRVGLKFKKCYPLDSMVFNFVIRYHIKGHAILFMTFTT